MDRFFHPKKIVLFGASSNPRKGGHHVLKNIEQYVQNNINHQISIISEGLNFLFSSKFRYPRGLHTIRVLSNS